MGQLNDKALYLYRLPREPDFLLRVLGWFLRKVKEAFFYRRHAPDSDFSLSRPGRCSLPAPDRLREHLSPGGEENLVGEKCKEQTLYPRE